MSDHISGPRALAEPLADITDVYAFPSPERPGHLVLVMNTLPSPQPGDGLPAALVYRSRLPPLTEGTEPPPAPSAAGSQKSPPDCVFAPPAAAAPGQRVQ